MRFLERLRNHIARRKVIELTVELPAVAGKHRHDSLYRFFPSVALIAHANTERMQLSGTRALTQPQFDTPAGNLIQGRHAFSDTMRLIRRDLHDAVPKPNV